MRIMYIYIIVFSSLYSCDSNYNSIDNHDILEVTLAENSKWDILSVIDSISFIPLQHKEIFYPYPGRFHFNNKYIGYLDQEDASSTELLIFNWDGNLQNSYSTSFDTKNGLSTINDFAIEGDSVFILHGEKISSYQILESAEPNNYDLNDMYSSFAKASDGFICYSSMDAHAFNLISTDGIIQEAHVSTAFLPTGYMDFFEHFAYETNSDGILLHSNLSTQIYRYDKKKNSISLDQKIDFGNILIDQDLLFNLSKNGEKGSEELREIISRGEHFFKFDRVIDFERMRIYIMKIHGKIYYIIYDKEQEIVNVHEKVLNNTGFFFLNNAGGYLPIYGGMTLDGRDYLLLLINSEIIEYYKDNLNSMQIDVASNWVEVSEVVLASSNPIIALMRFKD